MYIKKIDSVTQYKYIQSDMAKSYNYDIVLGNVYDKLFIDNKFN